MSFDSQGGGPADSASARTHLALPFGLIGFAGSWYVADYYRMPLSGPGEEARGLLAFSIPLAGAVVGVILSATWISERVWKTCVAAVLAAVAAGWTIGAVTGSVISRSAILESAGIGALTSLAFLPVIAAIAWLARSVGRARLASIVDQADRRGPWAATAACVALGRVPAKLVVIPVQIGSRNSELCSVSFALASLAVIALLGITLFDWICLARSWRAFAATVEMSPRDAATGLPCDNVVDVGVGDEEHEELFGGPAYRSVSRPLRVIRGTPERAARMLRVAVARSVLCTVLAVGGVVASTVKW